MVEDDETVEHGVDRTRDPPGRSVPQERAARAGRKRLTCERSVHNECYDRRFRWQLEVAGWVGVEIPNADIGFVDGRIGGRGGHDLARVDFAPEDMGQTRDRQPIVAYDDDAAWLGFHHFEASIGTAASSSTRPMKIDVV